MNTKTSSASTSVPRYAVPSARRTHAWRHWRCARNNLSRACLFFQILAVPHPMLDEVIHFPTVETDTMSIERKCDCNSQTLLCRGVACFFRGRCGERKVVGKGRLPAPDAGRRGAVFHVDPPPHAGFSGWCRESRGMTCAGGNLTSPPRVPPCGAGWRAVSCGTRRRAPATILYPRFHYYFVVPGRERESHKQLATAACGLFFATQANRSLVHFLGRCLIDRSSPPKKKRLPPSLGKHMWRTALPPLGPFPHPLTE